MKRLVYAPKVFAFIEADGGLIDISPDIVSGFVTRKINQVSQAELTIRNKNLKYTEQGNPAFHPMDKITIYLQRLPSTPVQVFTGYLDQTPYLQLYPGNCVLKASCTLKRLLYTYFDPGLQFTGEFLAQYGWITNYATGQLENLQALKFDANAPDGRIQVNDGSIARVLFATMRDIGRWDESTLFIEALPQDMAKNIAQIYTHFQKENEGVQKDLQDFFTKIIGEGTQGAGAPSSGQPDPSVPADLKNFPIKDQYSVGELRGLTKAAGFPDPNLAAAIIMGESSGVRKNYNFCCYGLWQVNLSAHPDCNKDCAYDPVKATMFALKLSNHGKDFSPWCAYTNGSYRKYL